MVPVLLLLATILSSLCAGGARAATIWPGYVDIGFHHEQAREIRFSEDCRAIVLAPDGDEFDPSKPTLMIVYATPNGNTAEQTLGSQLANGLDWHFDIQHAAAQWRVFRELDSERNVVLACVQPNNRSWPAWKGQRAHGTQYIQQIVDDLGASLPSEDVHIVLTGHSGGGSFIFGFIDAVEQLPESLERIAFLDANYGYDTSQRHGEKILKWLDGDKLRQFVVLAYDDRNIEFNGKKVVGPTGGTFRATNRMLESLGEKLDVVSDKQGDFARYTAHDGQWTALVHPNPENIILHTRLVGEMNGLLEVLTIGTPFHGKWGKLAPSRAYAKFVQPEPLNPEPWHAEAPAVPSRTADARGGAEIIRSLFDANPAEREEAIAHEILHGNVPESWRHFVRVSAEATTDGGKTHSVTYRVSPDYLAVGGVNDFVRVPLTPYAAQEIADVLGCVLPTRKMVNDIYQAADAKLAPQPMTEDREALATFFEHHKLIQEALEDYRPGQLVGGIKKDVVVTNKLLERPDRVAIYGWHKTNGKPIQPLTTVHVDWYVDYSHGIRLVDQWCEVDGEPRRVEDIWRDARFSALLSDEGPLDSGRYRRPLLKSD